MSRICPHDVFSVAHNGLNIFLTEYPHMDEEQRATIHQLIEHFARPQTYRNKVRRPALMCQVMHDDSILITPEFVPTANSIEKCP